MNPRVQEDLLIQSWLGNGTALVIRALPGVGGRHPAARGMGAAGAGDALGDAPQPRMEAGERGGAACARFPHRGAGDRPLCSGTCRGCTPRRGGALCRKAGGEWEQRHPGGSGKAESAGQ